VEFAVLLGSGLGVLNDDYPLEATVRFGDIPGLSRTEVAGHAGDIQRCLVASRSCLFVRGRKHYYEGKTEEIERLIRFLRTAGVDRLLLTSAAGSLRPTLEPGELVVVEQVLDCQLRPPSRAIATVDALVSRPGPAGRPLELDADLSDCIKRSAIAAGILITPGTLSSWPGPAYETQAEVYALQTAGASVASMSVAPEVAVANAFGIKVACVAVVTNWVTGVSPTRLSHEKVLETGRSAAADLGRLITAVVAEGVSR
jgi:inosine/guanosine/xanthosine phosphorylase family protein